MKSIKLSYCLLLCVAFSLSSCHYIEKFKEERAKRREALVYVGDHYLYQRDIDNIIPKAASPEDSASIADNYIRRWATDVIMYDNAQRNETDKAEIDRMVEDYRRAITIHYYQQRMVQEKVLLPTDYEAMAFFAADSTSFRLDKAVVKGLWITMPLRNDNKQKLKKYMLKWDDNLEKIEKLALQYAVDYDIFINDWQQIDILQERIGKSFTIKNTGYLELSDSTTVTCLYISDFQSAGSIMPREIALEVARMKLYNNKKLDYLKNFDNEIYEYALRHNHIKGNLPDISK